MRRISIWVLLGISLCTTPGAIAQSSGVRPTVFGDFGDLDVMGAMKKNVPMGAIVITPDPEPRPDHHVAKQPKPGTSTTLMPSIPSGNIQGTPQQTPALVDLGDDIEPTEEFGIPSPSGGLVDSY